MHATAVIGSPADSPSDRTLFFSGKTGVTYNIGGYDFSPDDIEHGILRANGPHPSSTASTYFGPNNPRSSLALSCIDPRLHFILNCGAQSCPPIKVLSGDSDQLEEALKLAAAAYLDSEVCCNFDEKALYLPRLLLWYGNDFATTVTDRVRVVLNLMSETKRKVIKEQIAVLFLDSVIEESRVKYNPYNWGSNESE
jgi:hypothetical protein